MQQNPDRDLLNEENLSEIASQKIYEKILKKKVASGEYIYVENYVRSDGSRVHGYYRRKPTQ